MLLVTTMDAIIEQNRPQFVYVISRQRGVQVVKENNLNCCINVIASKMYLVLIDNVRVQCGAECSELYDFFFLSIIISYASSVYVSTGRLANFFLSVFKVFVFN